MKTEKQTLIKGKPLTEEKVSLLLSTKSEDITLELMRKFFAYKEKANPLFNPQDTFKLQANKLYNKSAIKTTAGRYIVNLLLFGDNPNIGNIIEYINYPLDAKKLGGVDKLLSNAVLEDKLSIKDYYQYIDKVTWLGFSCNSFLVASMTNAMLDPSPEVVARKKELLAQYSKELENDDLNALAKIETELLDLARDGLKDVPDYEIYVSGAKGNFNNNYKLNSIMRGGVKNLATNEVTISTTSLVDGFPPEELNLTGDILIQAPYYRSIDTQRGGTSYHL